jgi:NitT/TauT family transport system substrate-binding protein
MKIAWAALAAVLVAGSASAETSEVRVAVGYGLVYLPFVVMQEKQLIEQEVEAAGLPRPTVSWTQFSGGDLMNQALLSDNIDIANTGSPAFLTLWAKTIGNLEVKAIAAYNALPLTLVTSNPNVKTIADFTDTDRIALPAVKQSTQAIVLQIAAEKLWGEGHYDQLDHLTIGRAHADAAVAMLSGNNEINSHFTVPPYTERELAVPGLHAVLTTDDVFGAPLTGGLSYAKAAFRDENPLTYAAYFKALGEAIDFVNQDQRGAAEIYVHATGDKETVDDIVAQLQSPGMIFSMTPQSIGTVAQFMGRIGTIDATPESWKDLFFPEAQALPGS